jgi:hypothetical protein
MMRVSMIAFLTNFFNDSRINSLQRAKIFLTNFFKISRIKSLHQTKKFLTNFSNEKFMMTRCDKTLINNQ